ncbi:hypothetical protein [Pseudomonas phage Misse]|uniref:Uncharacterized protein n=1 Tax=Pseudomonas phage Bertil TaxID=2801385 RepID=A0A7T8IW58_9CAUD|nr:hypothetical protein [Pseudomonas phage Bertil]QQO90818.1 hypothetical protein [Pseudomonas phage Misse]QQO90869.1 hypothetical protein [Pseudomonas phage Strit]
MTATKTTAAPKALVLIVGAADLNKAIDSVISRGKKLDDSIQLLGLSLLDHTDKHGDIGPMNRLLTSFPKGSRRNAFAEWALAYGKYQLNTGADSKAVPFHFAKERTTNMTEAQANVWTEFKPEPEIAAVFDFGAMLQALIKKADKAAGQTGTEFKGADMLAKARELAATSGK